MWRYNDISTGMKGFDEVIDNLRLGDNVMWQVTSIEDYRYVANQYVVKAIEDGRNVVYIRFGKNNSIIENIERIKVYNKRYVAGNFY